MTSILLVDDNIERTRRVAAIVYKKNRITQLCVVTNVIDAKRQLERRRFDLMLLDICLPKRPERDPEPDGGLELLRWLRTGRYGRAPRYIVGITAFEESQELAQVDFNNLLWRLLRVDLDSEHWQTELENTLDDLGVDYQPPFRGDGSSHYVDLLVIGALEEPEISCVLQLPGNFERIKVQNDASVYYMGRFEEGRRSLSVVVVAASDKGLSAAAVAVTKGINAFWPRYVYMPGITAGVNGRTNIGDTIFANVCWDWGSGKLKEADGAEIFLPAPYQCRLNETLLRSAAELRRDRVFLERIYGEYRGVKPAEKPDVKLGAMASGASVLQSQAAVKRVIDQHKDLLAIEMEAFAVMFASETACMPRPLSIVAKTVCDNGDKEKNDRFQAYAAHVSARVLYRYALLAFAEESEER